MRLISGESLEGAEVGIEVLDPLVAAIGLVAAAVIAVIVVLFLPTPPRLGGSIEKSSAFGDSNWQVAEVVDLAKGTTAPVSSSAATASLATSPGPAMTAGGVVIAGDTCSQKRF